MLSPVRIAGRFVDPFGLGAVPAVGVGGLVSLPRFKAKGSELRPGQYLDRGEALVTKNGGVVILQSTGNLVLYGPNGRGQYTALWWSHAHNTPATRATMTPGGSLVLTDPKGGVVMDIRPRSDAARIVFQDDGNLVWLDARGTPVLDARTGGWKINPLLAPKKNILEKAVDVGTTLVTAPTKIIAAATAKIPFVGDVTRIVNDAASAPAKLATSIASGARLDRALVNHLKDQVKIVKEAAPYAQMVVSVVPGLGTGVAMAMSAGLALAEGQSITEAAKAAIRNALPGGPLVAAGFDAALKVAQGESISKIALEAARSQLPPAAQKAFDIGLAVATGEKIQTALANGLASLAPAQLQSIVAAGKSAITSTPGLAAALKGVAAGKATEGFQLAVGLLSHAGINEKALIAARSQLPPEVRQGFDVALKAQTQHVPWLNNVVSAPSVASAAASAAAAAVASAQTKAAVVKPPALREPPTRQPTVAPKTVAAAVPTKPPALREPPTRRPAAAPKPVVAAAPARPRAAPPAKPAAAPSRVASYPPYPNSALGVGSLWGSSAWRWFTVYANGAPIVQRGPVWLSNHDATVEEMRFLESTQGRNYAGTVARWSWNADTRQWRREGGALGALGACFDVDSKTWGPPIADMSREMDRAGRSAVHGSGGRPRAVRGPDGTDYLFAIENDVLIARPSIAAGGALSGPPSAYAPYLA
jgi:hypothetical protein